MAAHENEADMPAGQQVSSHWRWRPDWTSQRTALWWYVTFGEHPILAETGRGLARTLARKTAHLDVNPARWLHLTLREFGFADELDAQTVHEGVAATKLALQDLGPLMLRISGVGLLPGAVVRWVEPRPEVEALRAALVGANPAPRVHSNDVAPDLVRPHVSVAYARVDFDPAHVLGDLPQPVAVHLPVAHVTLAEVTRRSQHYEWQIRERVRLGSEQARPPE